MSWMRCGIMRAFYAAVKCHKGASFPGLRHWEVEVSFKSDFETTVRAHPSFRMNAMRQRSDQFRRGLDATNTLNSVVVEDS